MNTNSFDFSQIFKGKKNIFISDEIKKEIIENSKKYESEIIRLSNDIFNEWADNMIKLSKTALFECVHDYFLIFTNIIDFVPSLFPEEQNSDIFVIIVQSFLNKIAKNSELMSKIRESVCVAFQNLLETDNPDPSSIKTIFVILKSFHLNEPLVEDVLNYKFNFSLGIEFDDENVVTYMEKCFKRMINIKQIFQIVLLDEQIMSFVKDAFNHLVKPNISKMVDGVRPLIGELLTTPYIHWIVKELEAQNGNLKEIYEGCTNYIYDIILMSTRTNDDYIEKTLETIEDFSYSYSMVFMHINGAMNALEFNIREALNDKRMKFPYNFAVYIDSKIEESFLEKKPIWSVLFTGNETYCKCHEHCHHHSSEARSRSIFMKSLSRIENLSEFYRYFYSSLVNLTMTYGHDVQEITNPILDMISLITPNCRIMNDSANIFNKIYDMNSPTSENSESNIQKTSENIPENSQIEGQLSLNGKDYRLIADYLVMKIITFIVDNGECTAQQISSVYNLKEEDIKPRLITLSYYFLLNDNEIYTLDNTYESDDNYIRIPPFYDEYIGEMEKEKYDICKRKAREAIKVKVQSPLKVFINDSYLMIKRKVRPDTALILDILDDFIAENFVKKENNVIILNDK